MYRRPPISTLTDTLVPYTTLFRSLEHVIARDHRGLVDHQHGAGEIIPRRLVPRRRALGDKALMGEHEGGNRLRLDTRSFGQIRDHLVLESETGDRPAFRFRHPRDSLQHGRLTGTRDALNRDDAIEIGRAHA